MKEEVLYSPDDQLSELPIAQYREWLTTTSFLRLGYFDERGSDESIRVSLRREH